MEVQENVVPVGQAIQCKGKSRRLTRLDPGEGSGSSERVARLVVEQKGSVGNG